MAVVSPQHREACVVMEVTSSCISRCDHKFDLHLHVQCLLYWLNFHFIYNLNINIRYEAVPNSAGVSHNREFMSESYSQRMIVQFKAVSGSVPMFASLRHMSGGLLCREATLVSVGEHENLSYF